MKLLAKRIAEALKRNRNCTITPDEINLLWPGTLEEQHDKVRAFANQNGWRLSDFAPSSGALITKRPGF